MLYYPVSCMSPLQADCTKTMKGPDVKNKINSVSLFSNVSVVNTSLTHFELKLYIIASTSETSLLFPHITQQV
jgi:hypothetical protein